MRCQANNTKMVSHPNMGIIGTMGTGKTQFARSVIAQFAKEGVNNVGGKPVGMLVFDYKGDYKDKVFLDAVGGTCYKFNYPFNPLKLVVNDEVEGMNLPAITADRISDSFAKAYGLGLKQQSNIKQVIIETYADVGITKDPATWKKPVPTMEQVIEKYFSTYDANDKAYALFDKLRDYTIFTTDNRNCVSLFEWLDSVRVIDLTLYPDDTKKVIVSLILDLFYAEMRQLGGSQQKDGFRELRAMIMVDEAHGLGVFGRNGRGTCDHFGVTDDVDLIMGTFSKSLASIGGFIAADSDTINWLRHTSRTYIFSASNTPAATAAAREALHILKTEPERIENLWKITNYALKQFRDAGFEIGDTESPIIPLYVRNVEKTFEVTKKAFEKGVFINPVIPPACAPQDTLVRVALMATHTKEQVDRCVSALVDSFKELGLL